jgi:UrcA family protein
MNIITHNTQKPLRTVLAAAAVFAVLATGARADDVLKVHVKYADLDVATEAGATVLYRRIRNAADQACGKGEERDLAQVARAQACTDRAIAEAVAAVNVPKLTTLYDTKMGINGNRINLVAR